MSDINLNTDFVKIEPELIQLVSTELARNFSVFPIKLEGNQLTVGCTSSFQESGFAEEVEMILGYDLSLEIFSADIVNKTIERNYRKKAESSSKRKFNLGSDYKEDFIVSIINEARSLGSSDIHFEIYEHSARIRIRIDGVLIERYNIDLKDYSEVVNKIKIRSKLDITEKRLPQDGRIQFEQFDIRVSILPTLYGEKIVLRILGNDASDIDLKSLGMPELEYENYLHGTKKSNGIVLISGPTGSGKTTTLYATLKLLNEEKRNIVTVEDPIEYTLKGINQVQLKEDIGLTFSSALRSFLRQDPDIIMLGEIRDQETARMAVKSALTGHLVLSTIHTNSAWGTISRLIEMGVEPYLLANALNVSVAQRLVRKLCSCKKEVEISANDLPSGFANINSFKAFAPTGCSECFHTGYKGRIAIYEVIPVDKEVSLAIKNKRFEIDEILNARNIKSLANIAMDQLKNGFTSLEEVYPILSE